MKRAQICCMLKLTDRNQARKYGAELKMTANIKKPKKPGTRKRKTRDTEHDVISKHDPYQLEDK